MTPLQAQDLVGIWQGTMQVQGRDVRIQFRVTNDGGLRALMYNVDAAAAALPANDTTVSGGVRFAMPGVNGWYEGKLSADGTTLDGTINVGPQAPPNPKAPACRTIVSGARCSRSSSSIATS